MEEIRSFHWFETDRLEKIHKDREALGLPSHAAPFSILVAAMGNHWKEGCFEAVYAMAKYSVEEGYKICLYEEPDRCIQPFDAIGTMRNHAYMKAIAEGYEYLCYIDNDVCPPKEALVDLARRYLPIVAPIIEYPDNQQFDTVGITRLERNKGLAVTRSVVLSFVLCRTMVFIPWATLPFWENAIGAGEAYHWQRLYMAGHQPFIDTDVLVPVVDIPHFPFDHKLSFSGGHL